MKTYNSDFKRWLARRGPESPAEVVALWHTVVADNGWFAPYVRKSVGDVLEIHRDGVEDPLVLPSQAARDCFLAVLRERYCAPGEQLSDLEEDIYWVGSSRRERDAA